MEKKQKYIFDLDLMLKICKECGVEVKHGYGRITLNGEPIRVSELFPLVTCGECAHRHESEFCECRPDDFFCADGERNETKLANYYNELIVNLETAGEWERLGELSDHDRSNLYFQAANAIRQLRKERERCEGCAKATREVIERLQDRIAELMKEQYGK